MEDSKAVVPASLIITKVLIPKLPPDLLRRPRLVDFIHAHIERKLILISASAGYGKTALLIDYAHDTDLPVCWYSLDAADGDPRLFLEYLIASIRQRFPDFGDYTLAVLRESADDHLEPTVNALINEIQERIHDYFVIVLDDYQEVEDSQPVNAIVDRLLQYSPEHCHMILSTRTYPLHLSLTTLTARQQTAGLGVNELRFTPAEIQALARQNYQIALTEEQAAELATYTEGWITGILLTTHTMWEGLFQSLIRVRGTGSKIFEYLATEVFQRQPREIQEFLLSTAVLREMSPALCDALLGRKHSIAVLNELEARNLFISRLEGPEPWFRYHPLFREFLEHRLQTEAPTRHQELHLRAGRLAQVEGRWDAAIHHFTEAQAFDLVAQTIELAAEEVYERGQWRTLIRWMDALPPPAQDRRPMLKFWRAKIYIEIQDLDEALRLFDEVCESFAASGRTDGWARAMVERGNTRRLIGDYTGAIADCETVLKMDGSIDPSIVAMAHRVIGTCHLLRGEFQAAARELEEALRICRERHDRESEACLYQDLGTAYELTGDIDRAAACFQQALHHWEASNKPWALANTLNSIGVEYYLRGNYKEAMKALERALTKAREAGYARIEGYALASLGDLYRDMGRLDKAIQAYQDGLKIARQINEAFIHVYILASLGDACRLQGQRQRAHELIQEALFLAESHQSSYEIGLSKLYLGILYADRNELAEARKQLQEAAALFERGGAQRELARAELQLAYLDFISHRTRHALSRLARVLEIATRIGQDQFMLIDGVRLLPLYRYAIRQRIGLTRLRRIRDRIDAMRREQRRARRRLPAEPARRELYLQAFALGPSRVVKNGRLLERADWGSAVTKELFFFLLEHRQPLRKEQIIDVFWPEVSEERANSNFHSTAYRLRRAIAPHVLLYENGLYRLNKEIEIWYDVEVFQELMARIRQQDLPPDRQESLLEEALGMYYGDYVAECYSDWCIPQREALQELYLEALFRLGQIRIAKGETEDASELFETILEFDGCREDVYGLLMQACALEGDRTGIIYWYRRCQEALREELGVGPLPETTRLYEELLKSV